MYKAVVVVVVVVVLKTYSILSFESHFGLPLCHLYAVLDRPAEKNQKVVQLEYSKENSN